MIETTINYCDPDWAFVSSDERRWHNAIAKLAKDNPNECIIIKTPEENDGVIYAKFPPKWVRIRPPKQLNLTDEEKQNRAQKLRESRRNRTSDSDDV